MKKSVIPHKFINEDFLGFLSFLVPLDEGAQVTKQRMITGEGSLEELANDFQLLILHGIDLDDILKVLGKGGFVEILKKENYIQYGVQDIVRLIDEVKTRIN